MTTDRPAAGQHWDPAAYAANAGFVPALGAPVLELLAPRPGERILDLGCGDGVLTAQLAASGARVTGLEPDPRLAAAARGRGIEVLEQDAHRPFGDALHDAIFSNAALHWMRDPQRVLDNAARALRPGGRLVAEQGGFGNVAAVVTALLAALEAGGHAAPAPFPWDFPSPTGQRRRLAAAGLEPVQVALIPRPTPLPTGMAGWLATFADPFLSGVDPTAHAAVRADALRRMGALNDPDEGWIADYVRLRFVARRPG
jgi:SAM-dependent methyltransferase